jgi:hypothetical protein
MLRVAEKQNEGVVGEKSRRSERCRSGISGGRAANAWR